MAGLPPVWCTIYLVHYMTNAAVSSGVSRKKAVNVNGLEDDLIHLTRFARGANLPVCPDLDKPPALSASGFGQTRMFAPRKYGHYPCIMGESAARDSAGFLQEAKP